MKKILKSEKIKSLFPYFLLALSIFITYKAITEIKIIIDFIKQVWKIITPFFYGFILAYILNIPCGGIQKLLSKVKIKFICKHKKALSLFLVYIILAITVYLVLNLIIPAISGNISLFTANLPFYYGSIVQFVEYINSFELPGININAVEIVKLLQNFIQNLNVNSLTSSFNALLGVSSAVFNGILAFISSIYILIEKDKIQKYFSRLLKIFTSTGVYNAIMNYTRKLNENFKQYIKTQTIDGCILGTIATLELFVLHSPYFLVLGIMLAILNYIPYFGSIIGTVIAILIVAFTQGFTTMIIASIVLFITQQIDGNIIQPRLMGGSFSLSPLLIIISVTIGGAAAGVFGMIAVVPIVAVLKDILDGIITKYEEQKF